MEKTKETIIADLYALRGGLSVISCELDLVKNKNEDIKNRESNEFKCKDRYNKAKRDIQSDRESRNWLKMRMQQLEAKEKKGHLGGASRVFLFILLIIGVISLIGAIWVKDKTTLFSIVAMICWGGFFFIIIFLLSKAKKSKQKYRKEHNNCKKELEKLDSKLSWEENEVIEKKKEYEAALKARQEVKLLKEEVFYSIEKAKGLKNTLNEIYDVWLDERDWENIDLLLYYFETGRADTVKEALQLLDKQKQTNQILRAIDKASVCVCNTIQSSVNRLGMALAQSFSVISRQIADLDNSVKLSNSISQNMQQLLRKQLTATELNNALLEKSNMTSRELLNDLRYGQQFWIE